MTFICVGVSHVAKPLTPVQLLRICSFVEEFLLANPTLSLCYPSEFRNKPEYQAGMVHETVRLNDKTADHRDAKS
jgi:hypothetical protein